MIAEAMVWLLTSLTFSLIYLCGFCYRPESRAKSIVKTASILCLAATVWINGTGGLWYPWLFAALLACAAGYFLLSRDGEGWFLAGMGAFALGHIAYAVLFLDLISAGGAGLVPHQAGVALAILIGAVGMSFLLWSRTGPLRWPVQVYICIIAAMGLLGAQVQTHQAIAAGVFLFAVSDSLIGIERFVLVPMDRPRLGWSLAIWSTYWLSQLVILLAVLLPI